MYQPENNRQINGNLEPEIGRKLDYIFGKATGRQHNFERSLSMLKALERIGIHDTSTSIIYLSKHFQPVFHNQLKVGNKKTLPTLHYYSFIILGNLCFST